MLAYCTLGLVLEVLRSALPDFRDQSQYNEVQWEQLIDHASRLVEAQARGLHDVTGWTDTVAPYEIQRYTAVKAAWLYITNNGLRPQSDTGDPALSGLKKQSLAWWNVILHSTLRYADTGLDVPKLTRPVLGKKTTQVYGRAFDNGSRIGQLDWT